MSWYYSSDSQKSILHARLRMLCSPLNDQVHSLIHVVESPTCSGRHVRENNKHFLLECPLYEESKYSWVLFCFKHAPSTNNIVPHEVPL